MIDVFVFILTAIAGVLVLVGCVFLIAGGVGLIRFPDLYTRVHAAGVMDTGAVIFLTLAMTLIALVEYQNPWIAAKLFFILLFTLFTGPTASHALAKAALLSGLVPKDEHGKPIVDSPELAAKIALSRAPKDGVLGVASGVDENNARLVRSGPSDEARDDGNVTP